jgi:hypothetical protein
MEQRRETWFVVDSRTNRQASIAAYYTREQVEAVIEDYRKRDARGGRPDLHDTVPFLVPGKRGEIEEW